MNNKTKIFCNRCRQYTNHQQIFSHNVGEESWMNSDYPDDIEPDFIPMDKEIILWECCGCDQVTMEEQTTDTDLQEVDVEYYPPREKYYHHRKSFLQLNLILTQIYEETILCFNNNSPILCATGLRALLEGVCADKAIEGRVLANKINNLNTILPGNIVENLHHFRFIGNEAVHQLVAPSTEDLRSGIEVMESLLNYLYSLDYKAANLFRKAGVETSGSQQIRPKIDVIKRILDRRPYLSPRPKTLFKVLYQAGNDGLKFEDIAAQMEGTPSQLSGVLGALGRRINNTPGVEGKPGISYMLEIVHEIDSDPQAWGWRMRYELMQLIRDSNYPWAEEWK